MVSNDRGHVVITKIGPKFLCFRNVIKPWGKQTQQKNGCLAKNNFRNHGVSQKVTWDVSWADKMHPNEESRD